MVKKDIADQVVQFVESGLSANGLSCLKHEVYNWRDRLWLVFEKDGFQEDFNAIFERLVSEAISKFSSFVLPKSSVFTPPEDDDTDDDDFAEDDFDEEDSDDSDADDELSPEARAAIAALPKFRVDECLDRICDGYPNIEFMFRPTCTFVSDEDHQIDERDAAVARIEDEDSRKPRRDHGFKLLPIPPPPKKPNPEVYLTMAYEPYDQIEKGEKLTEFREYSEYYVKKLLSQPLMTVKFQRGYGGPGHDAPRQMRWTIRKIEYYDIDTRESAPVVGTPDGFVPSHIAIDLGERIN